MAQSIGVLHGHGHCMKHALAAPPSPVHPPAPLADERSHFLPALYHTLGSIMRVQPLASHAQPPLCLVAGAQQDGASNWEAVALGVLGYVPSIWQVMREPQLAGQLPGSCHPAAAAAHHPPKQHTRLPACPPAALPALHTAAPFPTSPLKQPRHPPSSPPAGAAVPALHAARQAADYRGLRCGGLLPGWPPARHPGRRRRRRAGSRWGGALRGVAQHLCGRRGRWWAAGGQGQRERRRGSAAAAGQPAGGGALAEHGAVGAAAC